MWVFANRTEVRADEVLDQGHTLAKLAFEHLNMASLN